MRLLEEKIAGVNKEVRFLLLGGKGFYLECFSGQPAQWIGVSATRLNLSLDIIGVKEKKGLQESGVEAYGCCH